MATKKIKINRAPVLTLWAAVVAERLGYDEETALTLGKAVAGLNAQSKGKKLGIYEEKSEDEKKFRLELYLCLLFGKKLSMHSFRH